MYKYKTTGLVKHIRIFFNNSILKTAFLLLIFNTMYTSIYSQSAPTTNRLDILKKGQNIGITWDAIPGASLYEILHAGSRLGKYSLIGSVSGLEFDHATPNPLKYENYYKIIAKNASGDTLSEQMISFEKKLFGEHVYFYDAKYDDISDVEQEINTVGDSMRSSVSEVQMSANRYAMYLKPGKYDGFTEVRIGFYTSFAGLAITPVKTILGGGLRAPAALGNGTGNNVTHNFWRSVENFEINKGVFNWSVSQAAPARRINVNGIASVFDERGGWASGGFAADINFNGAAGSGSQQQWYTRNSHFAVSAFSGVAWNKVTQGSTGEAHASNYLQGGNSAWIDETPIIREKPFLYLDDDGEYKVFVPALRKNAKGLSWTDNDPGVGISIDLEKSFFIAKPGVTAAEINAQLEQGKHLFFTPGLYEMETPVHITKPNTVVLGTGFATLFPAENNKEGALLVADVPGVTVASLLFDAHYSSKYLLRVGETNANNNHSDNPTLLADCFLRVGGYKATPVHAEVSAQINSNDVIGDHFWLWRADHGRGVGWDVNTAPYGLIVSGNNVTMYGLFVEHYQKYQTIWLGENGKTFFYQNESPYDPPAQERYMSHNGTVNGWSAYKVANSVDVHYAIGVGMYGVLNRAVISIENGMEVPDKPGVKVEHVFTLELGRSGSGTNSVVNGTGDSATNATPRRVAVYNNGTATTASSKNTGTQPLDGEFTVPK